MAKYCMLFLTFPHFTPSSFIPALPLTCLNFTPLGFTIAFPPYSTLPSLLFISPPIPLPSFPVVFYS